VLDSLSSTATANVKEDEKKDGSGGKAYENKDTSHSTRILEETRKVSDTVEKKNGA